MGVVYVWFSRHPLPERKKKKQNNTHIVSYLKLVPLGNYSLYFPWLFVDAWWADTRCSCSCCGRFQWKTVCLWRNRQGLPYSKTSIVMQYKCASLSLMFTKTHLSFSFNMFEILYINIGYIYVQMGVCRCVCACARECVYFMLKSQYIKEFYINNF